MFKCAKHIVVFHGSRMCDTVLYVANNIQSMFKILMQSLSISAFFNGTSFEFSVRHRCYAFINSKGTFI